MHACSLVKSKLASTDLPGWAHLLQPISVSFEHGFRCFHIKSYMEFEGVMQYGILN